VRRALLLFLAVLAVLPASAGAARDQESTFQDDEQLVYTTPAKQRKALDRLATLGADRIRVTLLWRAIAPDHDSRTKPEGFDAADPGSYPPGTWTSYDNLVREAAARGMGVNFNVTGPSPRWANRKAPRRDIADNYEPSPNEFGQFVVALGRRYSGTWPDGDGGVVPRVDYWSIWNEPNHSGWLTPTWKKVRGRFVERSASLYRSLLDNAWGALGFTGHGTDTILFGETAPAGNDSKGVKRFMTPLTFLRALYCVDRRLHRLTGRAAKRLRCPTDAKAFVTGHPALFRATGYAHHPYQLLTAPDVRGGSRNQVTVATLGRLERTLDTLQRRYGQRRRFPLYLTEFGYQTPPDPLGVPLRKQATYINQAEYMVSRNRRVRTLAQFLLVDDGAPIGTTFQSGLVTRSGARKPAYAAYRLPIWVRGSGTSRRVWGVLRPAAPDARVTAQIQFRRKGSRTWRTVRTVRSSGEHNVVSATVRAAGRGRLRIAYGSLRSRSARVRWRP